MLREMRTEFHPWSSGCQASCQGIHSLRLKSTSSLPLHPCLPRAGRPRAAWWRLDCGRSICICSGIRRTADKIDRESSAALLLAIPDVSSHIRNIPWTEQGHRRALAMTRNGMPADSSPAPVILPLFPISVGSRRPWCVFRLLHFCCCSAERNRFFLGKTGRTKCNLQQSGDNAGSRVSPLCSNGLCRGQKQPPRLHALIASSLSLSLCPLISPLTSECPHTVMLRFLLRPLRMASQQEPTITQFRARSAEYPYNSTNQHSS